MCRVFSLGNAFCLFFHVESIWFLFLQKRIIIKSKNWGNKGPQQQKTVRGISRIMPRRKALVFDSVLTKYFSGFKRNIRWKWFTVVNLCHLMLILGCLTKLLMCCFGSGIERKFLKIHKISRFSGVIAWVDWWRLANLDCFPPHFLGLCRTFEEFVVVFPNWTTLTMFFRLVLKHCELMIESQNCLTTRALWSHVLLVVK